MAQTICAKPEQLGCTPGEACANGDGTCYEGVCLLNECGNGRTDLVEVCDDGNTVDGDGCNGLCTSLELCGNGIIDGVAGEQCDLGVAGLSGDGCTSTCAVEALAWTDVTPTRMPGRAGHTMAYDAVRQVLVVFGGISDSKELGDTWEGTGGRWTQRVLGRSPSARAYHAMAYDGTHILLFGGADSAYLNDTWELVDDTWVQRQPATAPEPRIYAKMAYDSLHQRVVLFGGFGPGFIEYRDTWLYDPTAGTWTKQNTPTAPPNGANFLLAYDEARQRVTYVALAASATQTWAWNGTAWSQLSPNSSPPAEKFDVLAYEGFSNVLVMFGEDPNQATWTFNGTTWTQASVGTGPGAREAMAAAYDPLATLLVSFGGIDYSGAAATVYDDTSWWRLDAGWGTYPVVDPSPEPRGAHALAYNTRQGKGVLYGGAADIRDLTFNNTWFWSNGAWTLAPLNGPPPRANHAMTYDSDRDRIVMFGGANHDFRLITEPFVPMGDTWELDVDAPLWTSMNPLTSPPARRRPGLAYDANAKRVVMFGGMTCMDGNVGGLCTTSTSPAFGNQTLLGDTWTWDGTNWTQVTTGTAPSAREGAAMAYDPLRKRTVLFGGSTGVFGVILGDTWEWDGSTWTQLTPPMSPGQRFLATMNYDPYRQRIVLAFGRGVGGDFDDAWEWDGTTWTRVVTTGGTGPRTTAMYDTLGNQLVTFGGYSYARALSDTLALQYRTPTAPRETCIVPGADDDTDGLVGCMDPDCWARCTPMCPPGSTCPADADRCGDGTCSAVENNAVCQADCAP
jgi:cysteine-rich repeat protein